MWVGVRVVDDALEAPRGRERVDDVGVGVLDEAARPGCRDERGVGPHGVEGWQALALGDLAVDLAERRREVHDARTVVDRDEVGNHDTRRGVEDERVEGPLVVQPVELADRDRADDLDVVAEHRVEAAGGEHEVARPCASLHAHVLDVGSHSGGDVRHQGPGCRGPHEQVEVLAGDGETDVHRGFGDVLVRPGLRELVARKRRAAAAAVRDDLVAFVDRARVPHLAELPPHALDVGVVERPVRVVGVEPHADPRREPLEIADVALHRLSAALVERGDAERLDLLLAGEAELLFDFDFHGQAVAVPTGFAGDVATAHRVVAGVEVFEQAGPHVVDPGPSVRGGRALVEHPLGCSLPPAQALREHVVARPALENDRFEGGQVERGGNGLERHRRYFTSGPCGALVPFVRIGRVLRADRYNPGPSLLSDVGSGHGTGSGEAGPREGGTCQSGGEEGRGSARLRDEGDDEGDGEGDATDRLGQVEPPQGATQGSRGQGAGQEGRGEGRRRESARQAQPGTEGRAGEGVGVEGDTGEGSGAENAGQGRQADAFQDESDRSEPRQDHRRQDRFRQGQFRQGRPRRPATTPSKRATASPSKQETTKSTVPAKSTKVAASSGSSPPPPPAKPASSLMAAPRRKPGTVICPLSGFEVKPEPSSLAPKTVERLRAKLIEERDRHVHQAEELQAEAEALANEREGGDTQFDEESGEGDTVNIERERDLLLSASARQIVEEIDRALGRIANGTYGRCVPAGRRIPIERLEALPFAEYCVDCKARAERRR